MNGWTFSQNSHKQGKSHHHQHSEQIGITWWGKWVPVIIWVNVFDVQLGQREAKFQWLGWKNEAAFCMNWKGTLLSLSWHFDLKLERADGQWLFLKHFVIPDSLWMWMDVGGRVSGSPCLCVGVGVCMFVYVYLCVHVCTCECMCVYVCVHVCVYVHIYSFLCVCRHCLPQRHLLWVSTCQPALCCSLALASLMAKTSDGWVYVCMKKKKRHGHGSLSGFLMGNIRQPARMLPFHLL